MTSAKQMKKNWKEKFLREFIGYWINVAYLALFFGIFITYKRLVLAGYDIVYTEYGFGLINALILGKVVSIGTVLRLGESSSNRPLIWSTLIRSVMFTIWLALFNAIELIIRGFFKTFTFQGSMVALAHIGTYEYLGGVLIVFISFIPFFAFKELSMILGNNVIIDLFFRRKSQQTTEMTG